VRLITDHVRVGQVESQLELPPVQHTALRRSTRAATLPERYSCG
jgi:hypothetical protein